MNKVLGVLCTGKFWKELFIMTAGMFVSAAAIYYFLVPSKLVVGNVSGLAIVISTLFQNIGIPVRVSSVILVANVILLLMAFFFVGKDFGAKTVYTALVLGPMMDFWELIYPYSNFLTDGRTSVMGDLWLDLLAFVLLLGAAQAILFRINASTGGLDILAKIINKYFYLDIGVCITISGFAICCLAFFINPFQLVVLGLMGTWINGLVLDHFMAGLNKRKRVCVISKDYDRVREYIVETIHRGCSLYEVTGGYSGEKSMEVQSLLTTEEFGDLMEFIKENNINAFITAGNVSEVYGLWFKHRKHKK